MQQRWFRLLPVMMVTFIIAFMDRTNIGFAIPVMGKELNLSASFMGFASGVLFVSYGLSQALGGWIADKGIGRGLVAVLMVLWGVAEISQAYVRTPTELTIVRFAIGFFEGGVFPTFILFVKNWFAPSERARANGIWQLCYPVAAMVSGPLAGYLMKDGDWRFLFIVEGIFPLVWMFVWLWGVADSPQKARWLSESDRRVLLERIARETRVHESRVTDARPATFGSQMRRPSVLLFMFAVFLWNIGFLGFVIWLPSVIKQQPGLSSAEVGWISAIPYACAIVVMQVLTTLSDRTMDRKLYSALPLAASGAALIAGGMTFGNGSFVLNMALLTFAGALLYGSQPVFWSILTQILPASITGTVTGAVNAVGVMGAFAGPYIVGYVRTATDSFAAGLTVMGVSLIATAVLIWAIREAGKTSPQVMEAPLAGAAAD